MKFSPAILLFITGIFFTACTNENPDADHAKPQPKTVVPKPVSAKKDTVICKQDYDLKLVLFAKRFQPTSPDLNTSMSENLKSFVLTADSNCLIRQKYYKTFIAALLAKLALFELKCCDHPYNLLQMQGASARIIIHDYEKLSGYYDALPDTLFSTTVVPFIEKDRDLHENLMLRKILSQIRREDKRLAKKLNS